MSERKNEGGLSRVLPRIFSRSLSLVPNNREPGTGYNKLGFYLFADDTNLLYAANDLKTLETVVNNELNSVCNWLTAYKLTINAKKSNFVIFRPALKRINHQPCIRIPDNKKKWIGAS